MRTRRKNLYKSLLLRAAMGLGFGVLAGVAFSQRMPEASKGPSVASRATMQGKPSDYVGWQTCAGCHRAEAQAFVKTVHAPTGQALPTSPAGTASLLSSSAAAGKKIYDDMVCAGCHTLGGQGGSGGPALDDIGARWTRAQILDRMRGRRAGTIMPPLPSDTSDQQLNELVDYMETLKGTPAAAPQAPAAAASPMVSGCETCHGPGKAHADAEQNAAGDAAKEMAGTKLIFSFHGSPKENSARCLSCHITSQNQQMFDHSAHLDAGVSCTQCHAAHLVKQQAERQPNVVYPQQTFFQVPEIPETTRWLHSSLLKQSQPNLCFSCHGNIQAQFALPVHHPVTEGLMKCSDCHNPHGSSINRVSLNAPLWETCFKCHVEKRGPFVYEHPAVKVEGCATCHNPHGSTNHFMLVRREGRMLCLQCHTGFHAQAQVPHSRLGFQTSGECTRCHVAIHGSDLDVYYLR